MSRQSFPIVLFAFLLLPMPTASGQEEPHPGNLISRMPWARLEIVFGRLRLTHCRLGQESTVSANLPEKGIAESLGFSAKTADSARLRYQYADSDTVAAGRFRAGGQHDVGSRAQRRVEIGDRAVPPAPAQGPPRWSSRMAGRRANSARTACGS